MIWRLTLRYLALFALVLLALSAGAYVFLGREYGALLAPAMQTAEGAAAYAASMRTVTATILAFDVPLLILVAIVSWLLARAALQPLIDAQERERAFAVDAAHALRSPLATISAVAQAQRTSAEAGAAEAFDVIANAALDASETVGDLLTLARSAHGGSLQSEPVDAGALARAISREYTERAAQRNVQLQCEVEPAIVDGDERRLRELIRNLLDNAVRHARSAVRLAVRNDDGVRITVWNDGAPISEAGKTKLFERFYRENGDSQGTGLGLAIVAWTAGAHGGDATVRNTGDGPEFTVTLPKYAGER